MPTYGTGSYIADRRNTLDELLQEIPDNSSNLIQAKDLRDSVYTLWDRIDGLSASVATASANIDYIRTSPTTVAVGGLIVGSTFSGTIIDVLDRMLYPDNPPSTSLSIVGGTDREFGQSPNLILSWSANAGTQPLTSIIVDTVSQTISNPTGSNSGTKPAVSVANVNTTFNMSVTDAHPFTQTPSVTAVWKFRRFWGTHPTFSLPSNSQILALSGAGVGTGNELSTGRSQTRNGINGGGNYLVFAWPTSFGNPTFIINGLPNTAFTKIGNSISFTNQYGYTYSSDVWISNTAQNSPITLFSIT